MRSILLRLQHRIYENLRKITKNNRVNFSLKQKFLRFLRFFYILIEIFQLKIFQIKKYYLTLNYVILIYFT